MADPARIEPAGSDDDRLAALLGEYHGWMERLAGREAGVDYDPESAVESDLSSLSDSGTGAWVAVLDGDPAGCVLLYAVSERRAEFKRLYVRPAFRGRGIGRRLVETTADAAVDWGRESLVLTTPPWSEAAHALYESMGFERTEPYPETRLPERHHDDAIFMRLDLSPR